MRNTQVYTHHPVRRQSNSRLDMPAQFGRCKAEEVETDFERVRTKASSGSKPIQTTTEARKSLGIADNTVKKVGLKTYGGGQGNPTLSHSSPSSPSHSSLFPVSTEAWRFTQEKNHRESGLRDTADTRVWEENRRTSLST